MNEKSKVNKTNKGMISMECIYMQEFKKIKDIRNNYIENVDNNQDLYEYLYKLSKAFGPDIVWEEYQDIIIQFWGDYIGEYSPYVEYSNFIGYNG